jgi:hypothetical protein
MTSAHATVHATALASGLRVGAGLAMRTVPVRVSAAPDDSRDDDSGRRPAASSLGGAAIARSRSRVSSDRPPPRTVFDTVFEASSSALRYVRVRG